MQDTSIFSNLQLEAQLQILFLLVKKTLYNVHL